MLQRLKKILFDFAEYRMDEGESRTLRSSNMKIFERSRAKNEPFRIFAGIPRCLLRGGSFLIIGIIFISNPVSLCAQAIPTEVSHALKENFKNNYGYPWDEASEIVQKEFFRIYNARVKKQQRIDRRLEIRKKWLDRQAERIKIMKKRKEAAVKKRREKLKLRKQQIKDKNNRRIARKMETAMTKLQELRKKSQRRR